MRQEQREIKDQAALEAVITKAETCRLAMHDGGAPYIVPMNFGYQDDTFYFHCAREGKKIDLMHRNPHVAFELEGVAEIDRDPELACKWNTRFQSVTGKGRVVFIEDEGEKKAALNIIMGHYTENPEALAYAEKPMALVCVFKVLVAEMTGKQSKHYLKEK